MQPKQTENNNKNNCQQLNSFDCQRKRSINQWLWLAAAVAALTPHFTHAFIYVLCAYWYLLFSSFELRFLFSLNISVLQLA